MKPRSLKPAVLVLAAVLILALLAAIVITQTARSRAEQAITLPGASSGADGCCFGLWPEKMTLTPMAATTNTAPIKISAFSSPEEVSSTAARPRIAVSI